VFFVVAQKYCKKLLTHRRLHTIFIEFVGEGRDVLGGCVDDGFELGAGGFVGEFGAER